MLNPITVLMTGAGAPGAPGIIRSFRNNGERDVKIVGVDANPCVATHDLLDVFEVIPKATDVSFIPQILSLAKRYHVDVIQPLVTKELEIFSEVREEFEAEKIPLCISTREGLTIANNKGKLIENLESFGLPVPRYVIVRRFQEFLRACEILGFPQNIVCFKPTSANGSRGFRILDEHKDRNALLFEEKPANVYISFKEACEILKEEKFPELVVMEFLPGAEYSVDMLVNHGVVKYALPRIRNRMNGGISVDCTVVEERDVIAYSTKIAERLKLHGNIGVQVRRDGKGVPKILEINPRVQGSIVCCCAAGVNLPYYGLKLAMGEPIPDVAIRWNTRMLRYWNESYYDANGRSFTY